MVASTAPAQTTDYQAVFDQAWAADYPGEYNRLVFSLEAVFEVAGFAVTGEELATKQHNHICASIGPKRPLAEIAVSFIGWVSVPSDGSFRLELDRAELPYIFRRARELPTISPVTLQDWDRQIKEARLKQGIKGRTSPAYQGFIVEVAARSKLRSLITGTAQALLDARSRELGKARVEIERKNRELLEWADHLRRTAYIIRAFCAVAGIEDEQNKAATLDSQAVRIVSRVGNTIDTVAAVEEPLAETVVSLSLNAPYASKFVDLQNVWGAITESPEAKPEANNV